MPAAIEYIISAAHPMFILRPKFTEQNEFSMFWMLIAPLGFFPNKFHVNIFL